jgi:hypothetical protein
MAAALITKLIKFIQTKLTTKYITKYAPEATDKNKRKSETMVKDLKAAFKNDITISQKPTQNSIMYLLFQTVIADSTIAEPKLKIISQACYDVLTATIDKTSLESMMTKYRNLSQRTFALDSRKDKLIKKIFLITDKQRTTKVDAQEKARLNKLKAKVNITAVKVLNLLQTLRENKNKDWIDKVIYTQLSVGARFIEVLEATEFIPPSDGRDGYIGIHGVAKTNRDDFTKPILVGNNPNDEVVREQALGDILLTISEIRKELKISDMVSQYKKQGILITRQKITEKYNRFVNDRVAELFPEVLKAEEFLQKTTKTKSTLGRSHMLRKLYANLSYEFYSDPDYDKSIWISNVLGHESESGFAVSISYANVNIKWRRVEIPNDIRNALSITQAKMMDLTLKVDDVKEEVKEVKTNVEECCDESKIKEKKKHKRDGLGFQRLVEKVEELKANGTIITKRAQLNQLAGSKLVSRYLKEFPLKKPNN